MLGQLLAGREEACLHRVRRALGEGSERLALNAEALAAGRRHAEEQGWQLPDMRLPFVPQAEDERQLLLGNEAVAAASIMSGCRFYAGYPITPASEIL